MPKKAPTDMERKRQALEADQQRQDRTITLVLIGLVAAAQLGILSRALRTDTFDGVTAGFVGLSTLFAVFLGLRHEWARLGLGFVLPGQALSEFLVWVTLGRIGIGVLVSTAITVLGLIVGKLRPIQEYVRHGSPAFLGALNDAYWKWVALIPVAALWALDLNQFLTMLNQASDKVTRGVILVMGIIYYLGILIYLIIRPFWRLMTGGE